MTAGPIKLIRDGIVAFAGLADPAPGGSADLLFTERATGGTYTATLAVEAETVVLDVILYALAAPWAADGLNPYGTGATLNVTDGSGRSYHYQQDLAATPLFYTYNPASLVVTAAQRGWLTLGAGSGDYSPGAYSQAAFQQTFAGPGIHYAAPDVITATVETAVVAPVTPSGILLVKVIYFAPVTAVAAAFA